MSLKPTKGILVKYVSYQPNAWAGITKTLTIRKVLEEIKDGVSLSLVNELRDYLKKDMLDTYNSKKRTLPAVTFCCEFDQVRRKDSVKVYNNIVVIDIDKLEPTTHKSLLDAFSLDEYIIAFWTSPSTLGIKGLIEIDYDTAFDEVDVNLKHTWAFAQLLKHFKGEHNVELDNSGSDTTRLCFYSADPNLFIRDFYKPYFVRKGDFELRNINEVNTAHFFYKSSKNALYNPAGKNNQANRNEIIKIIKFLKKRKLSITKSYDNWYKVGFALANSFTYDLGEKYYIKLCELDGIKYNKQNSIGMLHYCYQNSNGRIKFATIVHYARACGYKNRKEVPKAEDSELSSPS